MKNAMILILENEETVAGGLQQTLKELGFISQTVVGDREQLVEAAHEIKPDLLLIEISRAEWHDDIETARKISSQYDIPLIYLSYHADANIFDRSLTSNPSVFLLQPFNSIQLSYAIKFALYKHHFEKHFRKTAYLDCNIFELSGSAMIVMNENGTIVRVNEEFERLSGCTRTLIENRKTWKDFFLRELKATCEELLALRGASSGSPNLPALFLGKESTGKPVYLNVKWLSGVARYIASMTDISEFKRTEEETNLINAELTKLNAELQRELFERENYEQVLLHQANHDSLTGLPNRQLFYDRIDQAMAYVDRNNSLLSLMILDLDKFKSINDTLGHIAGDVLLKEVARRLLSCLRKYDTVARFGGDEFVLVNAMPDIHDIVKFAEKVFEVFQHPFDIMGKPVYTTASIGIGIYPLQSTNTNGLLKMADTAMYQAKEAGGNAYKFFTESMTLKVDRHAHLKKRLKAALERDEFLVHYQPRIDVATRRIIGMEALIRWQPVDEPLAYPADFFSVLEESGLVVPVSEWLLEKICEQNKTWHSAGLPRLRVAVNISERQFKQADFPGRVSRALSRSHLDPHFLSIELPEQVLMKDVDESISKLSELKSTGVTISVDNFGTGFSSLTQLSRLPIDDIQIDRSLINCITSDQNDANVVSAIISMGNSLGKKLIAGGVESEEQFMFLAQRQCKEMQGHFFSRPLTSCDFEKLTRKYTL